MKKNFKDVFLKCMHFLLLKLNMEVSFKPIYRKETLPFLSIWLILYFCKSKKQNKAIPILSNLATWGIFFLLFWFLFNDFQGLNSTRCLTVLEGERRGTERGGKLFLDLINSLVLVWPLPSVWCVTTLVATAHIHHFPGLTDPTVYWSCVPGNIILLLLSPSFLKFKIGLTVSTAFTSKSEGDNAVENYANIRAECAWPLPGWFTLYCISPLITVSY